ncbi:MAG TPA: 2'-5' RNA ligase family protein, partial [Roseiflexaceae bacterium]|nr:2'-5' RNA ligase family protein [Roseiflexaceae bacterium]
MLDRAIVVFPTFDNGAIIDALRHRYDPLAAVIAPHITLAFPFRSDIAPAALHQHITEAVAGMPPFVVRLHAITGHAGEYLFLNVKRGNDELIAIHDRLYTGMLTPFLAPEFTFAPHLTVGRLADQHAFRSALRDAHAERAVFEATMHEV